MRRWKKEFCFSAMGVHAEASWPREKKTYDKRATETAYVDSSKGYSRTLPLVL